MRPIKFRAWTKNWGVLSRILYHDELELIYDENGFHPLNEMDTELIIMQFTGLHDKNGKEIYEGDIVKTFGLMDNVIGEIFFDGFLYVIKPKGWSSGIPFNMGVQGHMEVIGNIYENSDLLEGEKK